jgi:hypothetical protein
MQKNKLTLHDETYFNFFKPDTDYTLIEASQPDKSGIYETGSNLIELYIGLSLNKLSYERSNYTLLNFIGDIGALYATIMSIASFILTFIFRIDVVIEHHLLNEVFRVRELDN